MLSFLRYLLAPFLFLWSTIASLFIATNSQESETPRAPLQEQATHQTEKEQFLKPTTEQSKEDTEPKLLTSETLTSETRDQQQVHKMSETFLKNIENDKNWANKLKPSKPPMVEVPRGYGKKMLEERWSLIEKNDKFKDAAKERQAQNITKLQYSGPREELLDELTFARTDLFKDNIENFIGTVKVPLGIAGPVRVNGLHAQGDFYIPLATTEAALVASINRGISCINQAGGATSAVIQEGISRDPVLCFKDIIEMGKFLDWAHKNFMNFKKAAEKTTRHGKLVDAKYICEGNNVHMKCVYTTADASGQNIVTIATERILEYILENSPIKPVSNFIEGGMSGDKKANHNVLNGVRGKRVIAEVTIPRAVIETTMHTTPEAIMVCGNVALRGVTMIGMLGANCHFANALCAMSIALGQDPACVAEGHIGIARAEVTPSGDFYCSVTMPNVLCATVGGGTKLPSQRACLEIMGLNGAGKANALAEVIAVACLAGEISLGCAVVSGDFAKAHKILARDTSVPINLAEDSLDEAFDKSQAMLVKLSNLPPKEVILDIYGLYKQSTVGDIGIQKPSFFSFDMKAKYKYNSWEKFKGMAKDKAMRRYIEIVLDLVAKDKAAANK